MTENTRLMRIGYIKSLYDLNRIAFCGHQEWLVQ